MFSYSHIEYVVSRLRKHTETFWHTVKPDDSGPGFEEPVRRK